MPNEKPTMTVDELVAWAKLRLGHDLLEPIARAILQHLDAAFTCAYPEPEPDTVVGIPMVRWEVFGSTPPLETSEDARAIGVALIRAAHESERAKG